MKKSSIIISILFILFFLLRAIYLSADPPVNLSGSSGYFVDEGGWVHNARNKVLFGKWELDKYNKMYLSPLNNYLYYWSFSLFGPGFKQARLISLIFSYLTLFFFYLTIRENLNEKTALISTSLLGFNYLFIMFNRIAHPRMGMIFLLVLTVYLFQKGIRENKKYFFLAGITSLLAYVFQSSAIYFIPVLIFALFFVYFKRFFKPLLFLLMGMALIFLIFLIFNHQPHFENISIFKSVISARTIPHNFPELIRNILQEPSQRYFTSTMPVIWWIGLLHLISLFYNIKKANSLEIFALWWIIGGLGFFSIITNPALRWYISLIPPFCLLAGSFLEKLSRISQIEKPKPVSLLFGISLFILIWFLLKNIVTTGLITFIVLLTLKLWPAKLKFSIPRNLTVPFLICLFIFSFSFNMRAYGSWAKSPQYKMRTISKDLGKAFPKAVISGLWAPAVCLENQHKAYLSWYDWFNKRKDFFEKYKINYVFCVTFNKEDKYYQQNFPQIMKRAKLLVRYHIWRTRAYLYEIKPTEFALKEDKNLWEAELLPRQTGMPRCDLQASQKFAVLAEVKKDEKGYLVFGPYQEYSSGRYKITFKLKVRDNNEFKKIATLDVCTNQGKKIIAFKELCGKDFIDKNTYQDFTLFYSLEKPYKLEFRVYFPKNSDLWVDNISVSSVNENDT